MIHLKDLAFRYPQGKFALQIPDWQVQAGERIAVVGPSGSGKTTFLHLLAGILSPQQGQLQIANVDLATQTEAQRRQFRGQNIGLVFQDFQLMDYLNGLENILLPYRLNSHLKLTAPVRERAQGLARRLGVAERLSAPIRQLSQGEKQRLAVCRALLAKPQLLLADEPTGNLDPANKQNVLSALIQAATEDKATLIVVTHDHSLLGQFDRIVDFLSFLA